MPITKNKLATFGTKIHEVAKKLREKEGNKEPYKFYVKKAALQLKTQGFFKK